MRFSRALIPTVKEAPADATNVSHVLLTRAGFIRRVGAGMYDYLPMGVRVLRKVEGIVRDEMDRAGALEVLMPALLPAEYFKETGRWDRFGDTLFRLKDRKGAELNLGPTHEEIITDIARREIRSYRDMPKNLYQIQSKFRDEPRPRGGLLRCREFIMKDAYSFDATEDAAKESYEVMRAAYTRIFDRMGLVYRLVAADSGAMGGSTSAEFQVLADSGEDAIVACDTCQYAANVEVATVRASDDAEASGAADPQATEKVHTPGHGAIAEVAKFLNVPARALGVDEVFLAGEAEVKKATGAAIGFAGPVGFKGKILVDRAASLVRAGVTGANETDYHLKGVTLGRDYQGDVVDVRLATTGDRCPSCEAGKLVSYKGIEAGHIFILGTHYTDKMGAQYIDEAQQKKAIVMGCYGIGVSRLVATAIEQHHDAEGMRWPMSLAPYHVHLVTIGKDDAVVQAASKIYDELWGKGVEVLWDDRDERPGFKFKDADLIGLPLRITVGGKSLAAGSVEMKARSESDPKKAELVPVADAVARVESFVRHALAAPSTSS